MKFNLVCLPELNNIHTLNAHRLWNSIIRAGDTVIDATCGNGHDSLVLAKQTLTKTSGHLYCIDIQQSAILSTQNSHWQARADDMDKRFASEQQNGSIKGQKMAQVSGNSLP